MRKLRHSKFSVSFSPVDIVLMVLFLVLLVHAGITLFSEQAASQERTDIDIVLRTSAAAIFGYFLSAQTTAKPTSSATGSSATVISSTVTTTDAPQNAIGFQTSETGAQLVSGNAQSSSGEPDCRNTRILFLSAVGGICLIFLLLLRHCETVPESAAATISQFRDFIAASIGFLISCGKNRST